MKEEGGRRKEENRRAGEQESRRAGEQEKGKGEGWGRRKEG